MAGNDKFRLIEVTLDDETLVSRSPEVEHERAVAVFDLLEENSFALTNGAEGPYRLRIGSHDNRLLFDIRDQDGDELLAMQLSLTPFRSVIRDYFTVCESYYEAIKTASPSRIEAIDMGRRGLHDEGAVVLQERLERRVKVDLDTARRLFTLICALRARG